MPASHRRLAILSADQAQQPTSSSAGFLRLRRLSSCRRCRWSIDDADRERCLALKPSIGRGGELTPNDDEESVRFRAKTPASIRLPDTNRPGVRRWCELVAGLSGTVSIAAGQ